ncbi:hypothetical protein CERZMDRAFT_93444 [Cercospora zeae-maydis SCOH1-5]|uniref:Uncharacterized protein n=1 Tax=Cercospora zeae-maydis SCOH1-5 TaxID=717836 RepID=A0A6A6FS85_9PEZI|nr:hypothetical protein CERZMDRAFT_93444 [Cercospora zeae-maydis SCOH1-5]
MPPKYTFNTIRIWFMVAVILVTSSTVLRTADRVDSPFDGTSDFLTSSTEPRSPRNFERHGNTGNDAIPGWLGYSSSELTKPIAQLDAKGRAVSKGYHLACMMRAPIAAVGASMYQSVGDMLKYGWKPSFVDRPDGEEYVREYGLAKAFSDLRIPSTGWTHVTVGNTIDIYEPEDKRKILHPASFATYATEVNLAAGAMVATQSFNPEFMARTHKEILEHGGTLTPLHHVSDLLFLSWKKLIADRQQGSLNKLEHMFRWNSGVDSVQEHLKMAAGGKDIDQIGEWPGVSYPMSELQALATLSAGNAQGVAWLLGQHKRALGVKTVDRVNIFNCPAENGQPQWCVYMHIVPVQ